MTPQELQSIFALKGIRSRVASDEVQVQNCTFCGNDRWNLEVNAVRGFYHCWTCGARGRAEKYVREYLGANVSIPVRTNVDEHWARRPLVPGVSNEFVFPPVSLSCVSYLRSRGLDTIDCGVYEIGEGKGKDWEGRVVFQLRDYWESTPKGFIGRAVSPVIAPKYFAGWLTKKCVTGYLNPRSDRHILVEGVFDGIQVHKAGYNAAVLGGITDTSIEFWASRVPHSHTVVVMLDADAADKASKLFWRIYPVHPRVTIGALPSGKDPATLSEEEIHHFAQVTTP